MSKLIFCEECGQMKSYDDTVFLCEGDSMCRSCASMITLLEYFGHEPPIVKGEVIEESESPPVLERREVAVSPEEDRDSGTPDGTSRGNASNSSI